MKVFKRILLGFFTILVVAMCTIFIADRIAFSEFYAKAEKEMENLLAEKQETDK